MSTATESSIVTISYDDLLHQSNENKNIPQRIGEGWGVNGLGIIAVTGIPKYQELRAKLLRLSYRLATETPKEVLESDALTIPESFYSVGWSHGKEKVEGDKYDTAKGSFYANPITDDVVQDIIRRDFNFDDTDNNNDSNSEISNEEQNRLKLTKQKQIEEFQKLAKDNPAFYHPNVWPDDDTFGLPELRSTLKEMGMLIRDIGMLVGKSADQYVVSQCPGYTSGKLETIIRTSLCAKARLLHYFPTDEDATTVAAATATATMDEKKEPTDFDFSSWCGWHNDHCSMTGLVPAIYINAKGEETVCPDPDAGLYIKSRKGNLIHVKIPSDSLAFQIGETTQIHTGGILQATPHAVRGCNPNMTGCKGLSRESFAVFMEPEYCGDMIIPDGKCIEDAQNRDAEQHLPRTVRNLRSRWSPGMNFGEFSQKTFEAFY
eukprot:747235_1